MVGDIDIENIWNDCINQTENNEIKYEEEKKCCEKSYIIEANGYQVCNNCGLVDNCTVIDSDIFTFENGENNKYLRQYDNYLFPVSSTSTKISGNSRLAKLQSWQSMPYNERVIWEVSNELKSSLTGYFSQRVINDTLGIYKNFYEKAGIFRGENKKGFVAVCVYIAASQNFATVTPKDVASILDVDIKIIYKCIQKYSEIMKVPTNCNTNSTGYVDSFITKLGLPYKIRKPVVKILEYVEKYQILGGSMPQNICISTISFVCKEMGTPLDLKEVVKEFSASVITIEKISQILVKNKQKIFNGIKNNK